MASGDLLPTAQCQFLGTLELVGAGDWDRPTPCDAWLVRDLVAHLVSGEQMAVALLDGASTEEARAIIGSVPANGDLGSQLSSAFAADKVSFGTNWLAEAEHGGYYQALADGTYAKYGLRHLGQPAP